MNDNKTIYFLYGQIGQRRTHRACYAPMNKQNFEKKLKLTIKNNYPKVLKHKQLIHFI